MLNPRALAICLMIGCAGPLLASPVHAAGKPYHIAAARRGEDGKWQAAEALEEERSGIRFQIGYLAPEAARRALGAALGREIDLLPGRLDERRPGYHVFVLQVTNGGKQDVIFNPGQARLSTEKGDMKFALDYSALYEAAAHLGADAPALEDLGRAIFDRGVTIRPEGSVRKLLAFEAPREDRYKSIEVRLAEINVGPLAMDVAFPFRKFFDK